VLDRIDLVDDQDGVVFFGQQGQQLLVSGRPLARLDDMQHHVDVGQGLCDHAIHHAVHRAAVAGLEAGSVHEDELFVLARKDAMDAVAGGLRLARYDGDLAADQRVGQGGLAHVRAADDGDEAAAKRCAHLLSWVTATGSDSCADLRALPRPDAPLPNPNACTAAIAWVAASCSAARRLDPGAETLMSSAGMEHSTSNI